MDWAALFVGATIAFFGVLIGASIARLGIQPDKKDTENGS